MTDIVPSEGGAIQPVEEQGAISSFFKPDLINEALEAAGWNSSKMVEELVELATDKGMFEDGKGLMKANVPPKERMAAMKMIKDLILDAATDKLTGTLSRVLENGTEVRLDSEGRRLIEGATGRAQSTMDLLTANQGSKDVIDMECKDDSSGRDVYSVGTGAEDGPDVSDGHAAGDGPPGGDGPRDGDVSAVHGEQRTGSPEGRPGADDQSRIGGAEDERDAGATPEPSGLSKGAGVGKPDGGSQPDDAGDPDKAEWWNAATREPDPVPPTVTKQAHPFVPGCPSLSADSLGPLFAPKTGGEDPA